MTLCFAEADGSIDSELLRQVSSGSWQQLLSNGSPVELTDGQTLFLAGDLGDAVYLIASGNVAVFLSRPDGSELVLATLERGELLGEHYLFAAKQPGKRSGSARAIGNARLLRFPGAKFLVWLAGQEDLHRRLRERATEREQENLRRRSQIFRALCQVHPPDPSQSVAFGTGDVVFQEGAPADAAYFITAGRFAVYRDATPEITITELGVGEVFGEAGIIRNQPRSASVRALGNAAAIKVAREDFADLYAQSSDLRDMFAGLDFVYRLPNRGVSFNYVGRQGVNNSIERLYQLADGRRILTTWVPALRAFRLRDLAEPATATTHRWSDADRAGSRGQQRVLELTAAGRVVGIVCVGIWADLPFLLEGAVDGTALDPEAFLSFARTGRLALARMPAGQSAEETVCYCMQIKAHTLRDLIAGGHESFDSLRRMTGCGSVCGGCEPAVLAMLGQSEWIPVSAEAAPQTEDVRSFRLRPDMADGLQWQTGQHLIISGRIDEVWVSRNYTITSAPGEGSELEIAVKREPLGVFSRWLFDGPLAEKELRIAPPRGTAVWVPSDRPTVCLVAGIGVTPALAIVRAAIAQAAPVRVHVDYSGRRAQQMAFLGELAGHAERDGRVTLEARETASGGRLGPKEVTTLLDHFPGAAFHVCGPTAYMDAVLEALGAAGVPPERIHEDRFVQAGLPSVATMATPSRRAGFIGRAYWVGLALATIILLAFFGSSALDHLLPAGQPNTGHAGLECESCHANAPGTPRQQLQAQVAHWLGQRSRGATFGHETVGNAQCFDCHTRLRDNHAPHLFLEARYAEVRGSLAPHLCVSCHAEHQGRRVTATNGLFCSSCHADMKLATDKLVQPASPTHAELTTQGRWDTCMACHDYHGNHTQRVPTQMSRAVPQADVLSYFRGGPSPYGTEVRSLARRPVSAEQVKP